MKCILPYIWIHLYMCLHSYTYIYIYIYTHIYLYIYVYIHIYTLYVTGSALSPRQSCSSQRRAQGMVHIVYLHIFIHMHVSAQKHTYNAYYMYVEYICMYSTYKHTRSYTLSHTRTRTHTRTHTWTRMPYVCMSHVSHTRGDARAAATTYQDRERNDTCERDSVRDAVWEKVIHIVQPTADRVALNLEIISKTFSTNQNSAHGICDEYQVTNDQSHENPGTPGTKSKLFRNNLKMLCHPICNWLYIKMKYYKSLTGVYQNTASLTYPRPHITTERNDICERDSVRESHSHTYIKIQYYKSLTGVYQNDASLTYPRQREKWYMWERQCESDSVRESHSHTYIKIQ